MAKPYAQLRSQMSPEAQAEAQTKAQALMSDRYVLDGTIPVPAPDLHAWAQWFATAHRHVADTWVAPGIRVSTVFLGLDYQLLDGPPLLFETMVFGGDLHQECHRYSTWQEAEQGHAQVLAQVLATRENDA